MCQIKITYDIRRLRSTISFMCAVPRTRTRLGDRSFAVAGPRVWNCLPAALRAVEDKVQKASKNTSSVPLSVGVIPLHNILLLLLNPLAAAPSDFFAFRRRV